MQFNIIAHLKTCYPEKFGVPRQPGLVDEAWGELIFEPGYRNADCLRGLEQFSHVWLVFVFHQALQENWKATVRPPRLGGNERVGVFASRSPFRPNSIGLSCVALKEIDHDHPDGPILRLKGVDLVDGTPVLDIKPYIAYCDSLPDALGGFAHERPMMLDVRWQGSVGDALPKETKALIENTLATDPRPAYQQGDEAREYGCLIEGWNVRWHVEGGSILIDDCRTA